MAKLENTNVESSSKASRVDTYTKWVENVKDISLDLSKLKEEIKTKNPDKTEDYLKQVNININEKKTFMSRDSFAKWMDEDIEKIFDDYVAVAEHKENIKKLLLAGDHAELENVFNTQILNPADIKWKRNKDVLDAYNLKYFKFELEVVKQEVVDMINEEDKVPTSAQANQGNVMTNDISDWTGTGTGPENYQSPDDYIDPYKEWSYGNVSKEMDIANIYKDNNIRKYLEKIFDKNEQEELRRWTLNVNLWVNDGLAGIIRDIRKAMAIATAIEKWESVDENSDAYKLYSLLNLSPIHDKTGTLSITKQNLKDAFDEKLLTYDKKWLIGDKNKLSKILSRATWYDLDKFAAVLQSTTNETMGVKEIYNAEEMIEHTKITKDNVLEFLCDFNSDRQLSVDNKEQDNQGDIGPLFGQQVMFTIEQAIGTKNVELGEPKGEQLVIANIIKNMEIADSRNLENTHLIAMKDDPSKCTKENLAKLINGSDGEEGVYPMPEMKIFFLDAIRRINWWSEAITPDLYDTLIGKDAESILALYETQSNLEAKIDEILKKSEDPKIQEMIRKNGLVRVRETFITKIMTVIDNVEVTTNDKNKTRLGAAGVSKWRELHALKRELLEKTIESFITTGIHKAVNGGYSFGIGYGKEWMSESGRTKRSRWTGIAVELWGKWWTVGININLEGDIAEQYNYKKVINADLSKVASAKYVGGEGGLLGHIGSEDRWVPTVEWYVWVNRQQDPVAGINQINNQYKLVSEDIFNIEWASADTLANKELFKKHIQDKISINNAPYGEFIKNNMGHLTADLEFIVSYMDANKFFGDNGIFKKYPKVKSEEAITALLNILQSGNIETRRHNVIAALHGKVAITKLSFGATTNALTVKFKSKTPAPTPDSNPWDTPIPWYIPGGSWENEGWSSGGGDQDRVGIAGFYVGGRISTWVNSYVPNEAKYLFTQDEVGQGIGTEEYINNPTKDLGKYAEYLNALYNVPKDNNGNKLTCKKDMNSNRLIITFFPKTWSDLTLAKFLNIHATTAAQDGFSLRGNVLTIGNVGDMIASTITQGTGVDRILCLGTKALNDATRVTGNMWPDTVDEMTRNEAGNEEFTYKKIEDTINKMTGVDATTPPEVIAETKLFFDAEGKFKKPAGTIVTLKNITEGQKFTTWTITITKTADKTYSAEFAKLPDDKLTINYIDKKQYDEAHKAAETNEAYLETITIPSSEIKNTFAMPTSVSNAFIKSTEDVLAIFDNYNNTLYKEFMESIVDPWLDAVIDATDYATAFEKIKSIVINNPRYAELPNDFKTFIEKKDLSADEKMIIVDKFKTIFSYLTYLTNGKNDGNDLNALINNHRKDTYKKMEWPNGEVYPLTTDYRKTILNNLKWEKQLNRTPVNNLIGFTAFYRLNGKGRKYAMTPVGGTNILAWSSLEKSMIPIDAKDKPKAQDWFIKNLDVNKDNKKMVVDKINLLLKKNNITITENQLPTLIKWDKLTIDSSTKISIDSNWVFYLLGECGNESFGMEIKGITITSFRNNIPIAGKYTASWTPEKKYKSWTDISWNSHSNTMRVITNEKKVDVKHVVSKWAVEEGIKHIEKGIDQIVNTNVWDTNNQWNIQVWDGNNE